MTKQRYINGRVLYSTYQDESYSLVLTTRVSCTLYLGQGSRFQHVHVYESTVLDDSCMDPRPLIAKGHDSPIIRQPASAVSDIFRNWVTGFSELSKAESDQRKDIRPLCCVE